MEWGASLAYTFGIARERGDLFNFDFPTVKDSPVTPTSTDERHRLVLSGIVGLPLAFKLSTLITLGSGLPFTISDASQGFGSNFVLRRNGGRADGFIQYSQVDVRLAKDFTISAGRRINAFAEVFNLFNAKNYGGYDGFIPPETDNNPNPKFGQPSTLIGPARSLQLGMGYSF
jgi:hypothetical protein